MGYFPDPWKISTIKMVPKPGKSPRRPENYRPISLLAVPGKTFERIIHRRLRIHLEHNDHYNSNQFGCRQSKGTTQALALVCEQIAQCKADGGQCHLVLRDITKAFDTIWHQGLMYKILHLGLPENLERTLCSFLINRKANIKFQQHLSNTSTFIVEYR